MSVMVLLASKDGSKVATVACPECGRISRQILRNEYKSSPIAVFSSSHTCPVCGTTYASSASAERAKYVGSYALYTAQGEQAYNSDTRASYLAHQRGKAKAPNAAPVADENNAKLLQHITEQKIVSNIAEIQPRTSAQVIGNTHATIPAVAEATGRTQPSTLNSTVQDAVGIPKAIPVVGGEHSNEELLSRKAEYWKKQLLDLSKRNKMINYRETKRATLKILEPEFTELFNRLAVAEEELTFQRPIDKDSDLRTFSMLSLLEALSYPIPVHVGDIRAEGSLLERKIALSNLRSKSKLARDEQGTNILYLSFGFIEWRENNAPNTQWLKSPVLMMPVSLKLDSVRAPFTLLRYDDDIEVNPTLDYLFNERYGIDLPTFELNSEESLEQYMQKIEEIADQHGWKLHREVNLGLLSFLKISMYHDLNNNYKRMLKNPVIRAITGDISAVNNIPSEIMQFNFDRVSPKDCYQVVNSDSSQQEAILLSKAGISFVMQGPPGTGKSQTITNIISEAMADGKTVLFVSEKAAALQVVHKRLTEAGLDDFCLALHSHKAKKKEIIDSIAVNLKLPRKRMKDSVMYELTELFQNRQVLNNYVNELHEEILPLEKSLYDIFGELSNLQKAPYLQFNIDQAASISSSAYNEMLYRVSDYQRALKRLGVKPSENPWNGTTVRMVTQRFREDLTQNASKLPDLLLLLADSLTKVITSFDFKENCTWLGATRAVALLGTIEKTPLFPLEWSKKAERDKLLDEAKHAKLEKQDYMNSLGEVRQYFRETIFSEDLAAWLDSVHKASISIKTIASKLNLDDSELLEAVYTLRDSANTITEQLETLVAAYEKGRNLLPFTTTDSLENVGVLTELLCAIVEAPAVKAEWFDAANLERVKQMAVSARTRAEKLLETKKVLLQEWEEAALNIDADAMLLRFKTEYTSFFKIFKSAYRSDIKTIRGISKKIGAKHTDSEIISLLQYIFEIKAEIRWFSENQQLLTQCFGDFFFGIESNWKRIEAGLSFIEQLRAAFPHSIVPKRVIDMLCDKAKHVSHYTEMTSVLTILTREAQKALIADIAKVISDYSGKGIRESLLPCFNSIHRQSEALINLISQMTAHSVQPISNSSVLDMVSKARNINEKQIEFQSAYQNYEAKFGKLITGLATDWASVISDLEAVSDLFARDEASLMTEAFIAQFCEDANFRMKITTAKSDIEYHLGKSEKSYTEFKELFETPSDFDNSHLDKVSERVYACCNNLMLLDNWISCIQAKAACNELGLADFINKIEQQDNTFEDVVSIFKRGFFTLWEQAVIGTKKTVEQFRRHNHDEKINRFVFLDERQMPIAQERIRQNVISRIPDTNRVLSANDELSIFLREIEKKRRIMPLRKLFKSIPNLLLKLKPCMMMSPLSVAYFLEAESYEFDMVIFDEASQIFPQDAIGSIFRGKQVIIAGDSKQLPPTNFFATSTSNDEEEFDEENEDAIGTEISASILEETSSVLPNRTLLWHYRSKHENLIAFSNQEIYKNELVTFPSSVNNGADTGVEFIYVENGVYEGKGRNTSEARRCVELVRQHIDKTPTRSLGIIAFSESQQKTISMEIQKLREQHPEYEAFFTEDKEDEFFVKNLENVQGDERDTIIFSVSYAKTKEQRDTNRPMALRFGPLGQRGGERRLNVAITRAKCNIKLVSSILPADIDLSRTESEGIKLLRHYIEFAMKGSSTLRAGKTEAEKDMFLESVAEFLSAHGYKINKYVGCSGYKIDIAVVHPNNDNCFVAGIECDGLSYATAKSARDRDRLRKSVLQAMGWRIYRVWSPEWIARQDIEGNKLLNFIDTAIKEFNVVKMEQETVPINSTPSNDLFAEVIEEEEAPEAQPLNTSSETEISNPYGFVEYNEAVRNEAFVPMKFDNADRVAEEIKYIVGIEQPIYVDLLYQRMAGAFGNIKVTAPVKNAVDRVMRSNSLNGIIIKDKDGFITLAGFQELQVRVPQAGSSPRQINFIAPDEIGLAMLTIAQQAIGLTTEGLIDATTKVLGYPRKSERLIACMNNALERLKKQERIKLMDGKVRVMGGDSRG